MAGRTDSYLNLDGLSHQVEKVVEYVGSKIEFVEDSRSGGGASLVGSCRTMSSLRAGARVLYHSVWGQGSNATLTLTLADGSQTPTIPIYRHSDVRMSDDYPAGSLISLVYVSPYVAAGTTVAQAAWVVDADSDTDVVGYQLRTNSSTLPASDKFYRYRILFTSADGKKWVPANLSSSTDATSARIPNTRPIDPLGEIVYYGSATVVDASESVGATALWQQYIVDLGYSFNDTGAALTLSHPAPVYVKCTPNSDGSAVLVGYSQTLPTRADGCIYIFLGRAYSATSIEMTMRHPVYEWRDGAIREWDNTIATDILTNGEIDALLAAADA